MKSKCCNTPIYDDHDTIRTDDSAKTVIIKSTTLHDDLAEVLTKHGMTQNISPKRLAEYLLRCIEALDVAVMGEK